MKSSLIVFLALIMVSSSCKFIKEKGWFGKSKAETLAAYHVRQDSIMVADSIKAEVERIKALEQARLDSAQVAEQAQREWEARFKYHIIVGSFLTPEYADNYLKFYRSIGYDAQVIDDHRNRFRLVSAEVHDNLNSAIRRLHQYQDTVEFESWLYIDE